MWKLQQELRDNEKTWLATEKKLSEEAVQITTDIRKLKAELEDQWKENERMRIELTKKDNGMKELQTQLGLVKMEGSHYAGKSANCLIDGTTLGRTLESNAACKEDNQKFRKKTEEDIEIAMTTALKQCCGQGKISYTFSKMTRRIRENPAKLL